MTLWTKKNLLSLSFNSLKPSDNLQGLTFNRIPTILIRCKCSFRPIVGGKVKLVKLAWHLQTRLLPMISLLQITQASIWVSNLLRHHNRKQQLPTLTYSKKTNLRPLQPWVGELLAVLTLTWQVLGRCRPAQRREARQTSTSARSQAETIRELEICFDVLWTIYKDSYQYLYQRLIESII